MALTPQLTSFPTVREFLDGFSQSVSYLDESVDAMGETISTPATITLVTSSVTDPGITITTADNTITISGKYIRAFTNQNWSYIPVGSDLVTGVDYLSIPEKIDALITFNADATRQIVVTYTVFTSNGSATITQTVLNDWDAGKAKMLEVEARGIF